MSSATRPQVGNIRPDGSREITVSDGGGVLLHGELGPEPTGQAPASPRLSLDDITGLVAMAGRAPSVHNTQPWWFRACGNVVELYADEDRLLRQIDPARREMVISCGAALYGLRLGLRKLGYLPIVEVLPDPDRPTLIARVRPGDLAQLTRDESELLAALPHRHTHRGPFTPGEVPDRLVAGLRLDALAEGAELVLIEQPGHTEQLRRSRPVNSRILSSLFWQQPASRPPIAKSRPNCSTGCTRPEARRGTASVRKQD